MENLLTERINVFEVNGKRVIVHVPVATTDLPLPKAHEIAKPFISLLVYRGQCPS